MHKLEVDTDEANLISGIRQTKENKPQQDELVKTTDVIRSIEVQYEEIPEPIHEPIQAEQEFIIHELPSQINEIDVIDHEVVEAG